MAETHHALWCNLRLSCVHVHIKKRSSTGPKHTCVSGHLYLDKSHEPGGSKNHIGLLKAISFGGQVCQDLEHAVMLRESVCSLYSHKDLQNYGISGS